MSIKKPTSPSKSNTAATKVKKPATSVAPPQALQTSTPAKRFKVASWKIDGGEKIIVYGETGIGKSSLCTLAPKPVFLGLDEGGRKLRHPETNEPLSYIPGIETFTDVRAALQQIDLYDDFETVVIDTVTILEDWAEEYVVQSIPTEKGGQVSNIMGYGYNKGFKHLYNVMKGPLQDCDELIRRGKNVIFVAQGALHNVANPSGEDYFRAGLRLHVDKTWSIESLYSEWADHILRVDYLNAFVKDKKVSGSTERAIFVQPKLYFRAKSRTIKEPIVSFETEADASIWGFVFGGE